jgi:hypothetical protein
MVTSLRSKWAVGKARGGRIPHQFYSRRDKPDRQNRKTDAYVTNEQGSRRPIFNATLRAAASWLFFLRRGRIDPYESRYGRFARALKNSQLTCGDINIICETVH